MIVIWHNSPAHGGDPVGAFLTKPGLNLRQVNLPSYSPNFQPRRGHLGQGTPGSNPQPVSGNPCRSTGQSRKLLRRFGPPSRRSQAAMSHHPSSSLRRTHPPGPSRSFCADKCRFHLGSGLVCGDRYAAPQRLAAPVRFVIRKNLGSYRLGPHRVLRPGLKTQLQPFIGGPSHLSTGSLSGRQYHTF